MCAACCLQELRLLFDASGGGGRLNTIQLCALLQHMARLAPAPELLNATERAELGAFANEVSPLDLRVLGPLGHGTHTGCCWPLPVLEIGQVRVLRTPRVGDPVPASKGLISNHSCLTTTWPAVTGRQGCACLKC